MSRRSYEDAPLSEEHPPVYDPAREPPAYHSLEAFRASHAVEAISDRNTRVSLVRRTELGRILDELINDRLGTTHQPELEQAFKVWNHNLLLRLDGTTINSAGQVATRNAGFNYYHEPNWKSIVVYFEKLHKKKDWKGRPVEIVNESGQVNDKYKVEQISKKLNLDDVITGRKQFLQGLLYEAYRGLYLYGEKKDKFEVFWATPITRAVASSPNNLQLDHVWYRIVAVLTFVKDDVPKNEIQWRGLNAKKRIEAFVNKYKLEEVIAKMELLSGSPESSTLHRVGNFIGRLGGPNQAESSQTSLSHPRHAFIVRSRRD